MRATPTVAFHAVTEQAPQRHIFLERGGQGDQAQAGVVARERAKVILWIAGQNTPR